jgi:hypothetical protein
VPLLYILVMLLTNGVWVFGGLTEQLNVWLKYGGVVGTHEKMFWNMLRAY